MLLNPMNEEVFNILILLWPTYRSDLWSPNLFNYKTKTTKYPEDIICNKYFAYFIFFTLINMLAFIYRAYYNVLPEVGPICTDIVRA